MQRILFNIHLVVKILFRVRVWIYGGCLAVGVVT